jgi:hypothetical protein
MLRRSHADAIVARVSVPPSGAPVAAALTSSGWLLVIVVGAVAIAAFAAFVVHELRLGPTPEEVRELPPPTELPAPAEEGDEPVAGGG